MKEKSSLTVISIVTLVIMATIILAFSFHRVVSAPPGHQLGEIYLTMDPIRPGLGVTDYPGNIIADIPKGYAMVLIGELERERHQIEPSIPSMAKAAGYWLLENSQLDPNGHVGWGVPVAWDAYGDDSENPANTTYSISTAIVVDALLDWMEADPDAPGEEILGVVEKALIGFSEREVLTPGGLIPYSLIKADRAYDTFNSAAYLAGEMQRFVKYASGPQIASQLRAAADSTVSSLIANRQLSESGSWYWKYSIQENVSNDLAHAAYIVHGLRTYSEEDGSLAPQVDNSATVAHLNEFVDSGSLVRGWPVFELGIQDPARLYDLGMALAFACTYPELAQLKDKILDSLAFYYNGTRFLKHPKGEQRREIVVTEYENYLWRGLISCEVASKSRSITQISAQDSPPIRISHGSALPNSIPMVAIDGIDYIRMTESRDNVEFRIQQQTFSGVPLAYFPDKSGATIVLRDILDPGLAIGRVQDGSYESTTINLQGNGQESLEFRAATVINNVLYIVVYSNFQQANFLTRWAQVGSTFSMTSKAVRLPTLEDPAGRTYEMIPKIFLGPSQSGVWIVGGTLQAEWNEVSGMLRETRIENCMRVLEAVFTSDGPTTLCIQKEPVGAGAPFSINSPEGIESPQLKSTGIPYNLKVDSQDRVTFEVAVTEREFALMLDFDLKRLSNGWMEFGIENTEGRIPWSQLYYLNGFLDFLYQSKKNPEKWSHFEPLLQQMKDRLYFETALLDSVWTKGLYSTRAFSVDRSLQLFAVQTARLLLFFDRYRSEVSHIELSSFSDLTRAVNTLDGHIEEFASEGQSPNWIPTGVTYLRWPKGSAFYFDGLNVPFNHQNEWAYAVARTNLPSMDRALDIIRHFLRRIAPDGYFPMSGEWNYWWGQAFDGWGPDDAISRNKPEYAGDRGKAWISFRSIDAMAALSLADQLPKRVARALYQSSAALVESGALYPFVSYELERVGVETNISPEVVRSYIRISAPWEIQNAAWAYGNALKTQD